MGLYNKIKWVLGILLVFVLIVTTNLIDRNNFRRVKDSVESIYEDRLIANDLLFDLSQSIQEKELAVATNDSLFFERENITVNRHIEGLITRYEDTKLTRDEAIAFRTLKENLEELNQKEKQLKSVSGISNLTGEITDIKANLNELSKIQLTEGSRQMSISNRAMDTVELFTKIEIYLMVFLAIVIQIIVMYKPKSKED
ncbi:MCP four helix bundle domain-containing protein [Formosa sp. S-31]|uniref:MCP four helix bundle domain-containing protein n=1 Tax=Formosa sp. S-31 TaxID=2790949 RepID=UPI003EC01A33